MQNRNFFLRRLLRIFAYIFVWLFFLYTLTGFIVIPFGLKWFIEKKVPELCNHSVSINKIYFNPYSHRLRFHQLNVADENEQSLIAFNYLDINVRFIQLLKKKYHFQYVILDGFFSNVIIDQSGEVNLLNLLPPELKGTLIETSPKETSPESAIAQEDPFKNQNNKEGAVESAESGLPEVLIDILTISNSGAYVRDESIQHPFEHTFNSINVKLENLSTIPDEDSRLKAKFKLLNGGQIFIGADLMINPLNATVDLSIKDFALTSLQPFIDDRLNVQIETGLFYLDAHVNFDSAPTATETLVFNGDFGIDSFVLNDKTDLKQTLIEWDKLKLSQVQFLLNQNKLLIKKVQLDHVQGKFILCPDGHNFQSIVKGAQQKEGVNGQNGNQNETLEVPIDDTPPDDLTPSDQTPLSEISVFISEVMIDQGNIHFEDQSIDPAFIGQLDQLKLRLKGLSNNPDDQVEFFFTSLLNQSGQFEINGSVKPLRKPLDLTMNVTLKNYTMQTLTPYVGKFAGYQVDKGKIQIELDYEIIQDKIKADHKVIIKNFKFGDKFKSEHTLKVPFKLAISLLEDINNQIHITLPVNGSISDPKFKYAHMITRTFVNFLIKIVAKPFSFLASVVGGEAKDQEFNVLYFPYGDARVNDAERTKLMQLIDGLKQRPRLSITVQGTYDNIKDWWVIKTKAFDTDYQDFLKEHKRSEEWIIIRLYQKNFGLKEYLNQKKIYKQKMKQTNDKSTSLMVAELRRQLIENAPANKEALTLLANDRAKAVVEFLTLKGGLDPKRITIKEPKETQPQKNKIPTELNLTFSEPTDQ
ncbi:MAG: DUF748 domain-containing protein [Candidatus Omnitrophica bacterium]|nr:DUF748 domain-containing protein [Candidatus Omnitrophota bacterium]